MNSAHRLVFDDIIEDRNTVSGTSLLYTSLEHSDFLASAEQLAIHATAWDPPLLGGSFRIGIETSGDGRIWLPKVFSLPLTWGPRGSTTTTDYVGGETWPPQPSLKFVRLTLTMENKLNPYSSYVRVQASARTRRAKREASVATPNSPAGRALAPATLREVATLLREEQSAGPGAHARVVSRLSPAARAQLADLGASARALTDGARHSMAAVALAAAELAGPTAGTKPGCDGHCGE